MDDWGDLPEALVREIRESERRCGECGAFNGPTHECPQYTATRFDPKVEQTAKFIPASEYISKHRGGSHA